MRLNENECLTCKHWEKYTYEYPCSECIVKFPTWTMWEVDERSSADGT